MKPESTSFVDILQNIDRRILYVVLALMTSIPLFFKVAIPVIPDDYSKSLYSALQNIPEDKTVFIQSDWTLSTRGENAGHLEAALRILMARKIKFAIFSVGDAQAPGVFRDVVRRINLERKNANLTEYKPWENYVDLGYFPNAEGTLQAIGGDVRKVFDKKRIRDTEGAERGVFESPVLAKINDIGNVGLYLVITASNTIDRAVERISAKTSLACMCTGVIGPSTLPWFQSGQLKGVAIGLKGVYDIEFLMKNGLNLDTPTSVRWPEKPDAKAEVVSEGTTLDRGAKYYLSFHFAIFLLIGAVITGNVCMFISRKSKGGNS